MRGQERERERLSERESCCLIYILYIELLSDSPESLSRFLKEARKDFTSVAICMYIYIYIVLLLFFVRLLTTITAFNIRRLQEYPVYLVLIFITASCLRKM